MPSTHGAMPTGSRTMRQTARERTCVWMLMSIWGVYHVNMCKRARWHRGRRGMWKYVQMCQLMQPLQRPGRRWLRAVPGRSGWDRGLEAGDLVSRHVSLDTVHALSDTRHTRHPTRQTRRRDQGFGTWVGGWVGGGMVACILPRRSDRLGTRGRGIRIASCSVASLHRQCRGSPADTNI